MKQMNGKHSLGGGQTRRNRKGNVNVEDYDRNYEREKKNEVRNKGKGNKRERERKKNREREREGKREIENGRASVALVNTAGAFQAHHSTGALNKPVEQHILVHRHSRSPTTRSEESRKPAAHKEMQKVTEDLGIYKVIVLQRPYTPSWEFHKQMPVCGLV